MHMMIRYDDYPIWKKTVKFINLFHATFQGALFIENEKLLSICQKDRAARKFIREINSFRYYLRSAKSGCIEFPEYVGNILAI